MMGPVTDRHVYKRYKRYFTYYYGFSDNCF